MYNKVSRDSEPCNYNMLDHKDMSIQFRFEFREGLIIDGKPRNRWGFGIDPEKADMIEDDTPLEAARALKGIIDSYIYTKAKGEIPTIIEFLERWETQDEIDELRERIDSTKALIQDRTEAVAKWEKTLRYMMEEESNEN